MPTREIFVLEDDPAVREVLSRTLTNASYDPIFFADGNALLVTARLRYPHCILLDAWLPGKSGLEVLEELTSENCPTPIFMISGHGNISMALAAVRKGALDFIEKPFKGSDLIARIEAGIELQRSANLEPHEGSNQISISKLRLTRREQQIVDQILAGQTTKEIARLLHLSPRTVEDHRSNILSKANVKTTAQLMLALMQTKR